MEPTALHPQSAQLYGGIGVIALGTLGAWPIVTLIGAICCAVALFWVPVEPVNSDDLAES